MSSLPRPRPQLLTAAKELALDTARKARRPALRAGAEGVSPQLETAEQQLTARIREIQEALGILPPTEAKARAREEVAKLPNNLLGVSEADSSLAEIFDKLAPLGLKRLYVQRAGEDYEILASASDPLVVRKLLALHGNSPFGACFLIARVDGQPIRYKNGEELATSATASPASQIVWPIGASETRLSRIDRPIADALDSTMTPGFRPSRALNAASVHRLPRLVAT